MLKFYPCNEISKMAMYLNKKWQCICTWTGIFYYLYLNWNLEKQCICFLFYLSELYLYLIPKCVFAPGRSVQLKTITTSLGSKPTYYSYIYIVRSQCQWPDNSTNYKARFCRTCDNQNNIYKADQVNSTNLFKKQAKLLSMCITQKKRGKK